MKIYKTTQAQRDAARRWQIENPERYADLQRAWRQGRTLAGPRKRRVPEHWTATDYARFKKFGITPEQVIERICAQGGCAICKAEKPRGLNNWHVDHDHQTGRIRGILCITCNIAVGMLHDDAARARAAAVYLEQNAKINALL